MATERSAAGAAILEKLHAGFGGPKVLGPLGEVAPDFVDMVRDFAFGELYARSGLDLKSRQLATVAALAAMNSAPQVLKAHLHAAMNLGWTRDELVEVLMQMALYAGFPAAISALMVAGEVFRERPGGPSGGRPGGQPAASPPVQPSPRPPVAP
jgi:4-carboxymuconolactone decarboxylase